MFNDLDTVSWASLPQPEWNAPDAVPRALHRIAAATSEQDSQAAYTDYLVAIGNNHVGTYYPVVLPTLPMATAISGVSSYVRRNGRSQRITQVIDGEFVARSRDHDSPWLVIKAIDSSWWEVWTDDQRARASVRHRFRAVSDIDEQAA